MDIGSVRAAMARKGLSGAEAARRIRFDPAYLSRVLKGSQRPSDDFKRALYALLDLNDEDARIDHAQACPVRLDRAAVDALAEALAAQRRADDVVGPAPLLAGAEAHRVTLLDMLKEARGPHRDALAAVVAEHSAFLGWLLIQVGSDRALTLCREAQQLSTEIGNGPVRSFALNLESNHWRGKDDLRRSIEALRAVVATDGIHPTQKASNLARLAEEIARVGDKADARRALREAAALGERAASIEPDPSAYWQSGDYQRLVEGRAHEALGDDRAAREHIKAGLSGLPPEWLSAPWMSVIVKDPAEYL
jgi:transcriptional regulator with XRE-family HTH domain